MGASSASGSVLACVAGVATLEVIQSENLCANAERQGQRLRQALEGLAAQHPALLMCVSGRGLLLGLQTANQKAASDLTARCIQEGVLVVPAFLDRSRILIEPPLCIEDAQTDEAIRGLEQACKTASNRA